MEKASKSLNLLQNTSKRLKMPPETSENISKTPSEQRKPCHFKGIRPRRKQENGEEKEETRRKHEGNMKKSRERTGGIWRNLEGCRTGRKKKQGEIITKRVQMKKNLSNHLQIVSKWLQNLPKPLKTSQILRNHEKPSKSPQIHSFQRDHPGINPKPPKTIILPSNHLKSTQIGFISPRGTPKTTDFASKGYKKNRNKKNHEEYGPKHEEGTRKHEERRRMPQIVSKASENKKSPQNHLEIMKIL